MTSPKESLPEVVAKEIEDVFCGQEVAPVTIGTVERLCLAAFTEGRRAGLEEAAKVCEKRANERMWERGSYDGTTNAWEPNRLDTDKIEEADDCATAIRALAGGEGK